MVLLHRGGFKSDSVEPSDIVHFPCLLNKALGILPLKNQESIQEFIGFRVFRFLGGEVFEQHLDALFFMEVSRCYSVPT